MTDWLLYKIVRGRPRLFAGLACGIAAYPLLPTILPGALPPMTRLALSWDVMVAAYLVLVAIHFIGADHTYIQADAARQEEGEWTLFAITLFGALMSFVVIVIFSGLNVKKGHDGLYLALVSATLIASWLMTNVTFAYRYAHEYYEPRPGGAIAGGLRFPDEERPDYLDFIYFAFVIGMTFQVSDVEITARTMRRIATVQGLIGYVFNTVILALTINIASGLI